MLDQCIQSRTEADSAEVDKALLSTPEKFLTRLTISTARLLEYISQDLETPIEDLSTQQIIEWFEADAKRKREQGVNAAVLKWQSEGLDE
jgi:hypothetical protein